MKKTLNQQRYVLALVTVAGLIAAGIGIFIVLGQKIVIDSFAGGVIVLLIRELGGGKAAAFAWFYDGSADKPPPATGTSTTTAVVPVTETPAAGPFASAAPTGLPGDPIATHEEPAPATPAA